MASTRCGAVMQVCSSCQISLEGPLISVQLTGEQALAQALLQCNIEVSASYQRHLALESLGAENAL